MQENTRADVFGPFFIFLIARWFAQRFSSASDVIGRRNVLQPMPQGNVQTRPSQSVRGSQSRYTVNAPNLFHGIAKPIGKQTPWLCNQRSLVAALWSSNKYQQRLNLLRTPLSGDKLNERFSPRTRPSRRPT
jgi:hypothetical protein